MSEETKSAAELEARVKILEARCKRLANERNAARASFARLAKVAEPFSNQSTRSLRHWLDTTPTDVVFRLSKAIHTALSDDKAHHLTYQIIKSSERIAVAVDAKRQGNMDNPDVDNIELLADRLLGQFDKLHEWDS